MITRAQLIEAIRVVAATEPDFVYDSRSDGCAYRPNAGNRCGCIVGEALMYLGVPVQLLEDLDTRRGKEGVAWGTSATTNILGELVTEDALNSLWITSVQMHQDADRSWEQAVQLADADAQAYGWPLS